MHCVIPCAVVSAFFALFSSHPCACHFLHLLISSIFLCHASAFLSSSYTSPLHPLCTLNRGEIAPCSMLTGHKQRNRYAFPWTENIPTFRFCVCFPPIPNALLPASVGAGRGLQTWKIPVEIFVVHQRKKQLWAGCVTECCNQRPSLLYLHSQCRCNGLNWNIL